MSWFESLKEFIGVHLHLNINNSVNIQINSNNVSKPLEYNQEDNLLSINLERLDVTDLEKLQEKQLMKAQLYFENNLRNEL